MSAIDPQLTMEDTKGAESYLSLARNGPLDDEYLSENVSLFKPDTSVIKVKNYFTQWNDYVHNGTISFGSQLVVHLENLGHAFLVSMTMVWKLPKLVNSADSNKHPDDVGSTLPATYIRWVPYIAERIIGDEDNFLSIEYGTQPIRQYSSLDIHIKRVLCHDGSGNRRAAYLNSVLPGSNVAGRNANQPLYVYHNVWVPWGPDKRDNQCWLARYALPLPITFKQRVPNLRNLIQTNVANASTIVADPAGDSTTPTLSIRLGHIYTETGERAGGALESFADAITYKTIHTVREAPKVSISSAAQLVTFNIERSTNPATMICLVVREMNDVGPCEGSATGSNITDPDWTRFLPWDWYELQDSGKRFSNRVTYERWMNDPMHGYTHYFHGEYPNNIICIPLNEHPMDEQNCFGHITTKNAHQFQVAIQLPAHTSANLRQIDCVVFEHHLVYQEAGHLWKAFR